MPRWWLLWFGSGLTPKILLVGLVTFLSRCLWAESMAYDPPKTDIEACSALWRLTA